MALSLTDALNQYGFVGDLANSIPELKGIFSQAAREEWDPAHFQRAVMDSAWWKSSSEYTRQLATQRVTDPATFERTLANAASKIQLMASQMGVYRSDTKAIALRALSENWDDEQIRAWLGAAGTLRTRPEAPGALAGNAADLQAYLNEVATNYGIPFSTSWVNSWIRAIQSGTDTLDGFESIARARAKATYPQFAEMIDGGMTVRDIADPYISTMANTLEVSETEIPLTDRWVKQALSQKQPDGRLDAMPLWEFERKLKDDPRWDKTKQAREQAFDTVAQVGRDFGFLAGGA